VFMSDTSSTNMSLVLLHSRPRPQMPPWRQ